MVQNNETNYTPQNNTETSGRTLNSDHFESFGATSSHELEKGIDEDANNADESPHASNNLIKSKSNPSDYQSNNAVMHDDGIDDATFQNQRENQAQGEGENVSHQNSQEASQSHVQVSIEETRPHPRLSKDKPRKSVKFNVQEDSSSSSSSSSSTSSANSTLSAKKLLRKKKRKKPIELDHPFHTFTVDRTAELLDTPLDTGLGDETVKHLTEKYGPNELKIKGKRNPVMLFLGHLFNSLTIVLFAAMALSYGTQEWLEGTVIAVVIILNAIIGFAQEYRSERTMDSLRKMSSPECTVFRDGEQCDVPSKAIVPGDVVCLEDGDIIPADMRLIEVSNLEVDESLLTGESMPVEKETQPLTDPETPLGDRVNMAYNSCVVTKGRARGIAVATGMDTELGYIASKLASVKQKKTPMQKKLDAIAWILFFVALILAVIVFAANKFEFDSEVVLYAIGLGVGVIPEGLVAVITMTMALGVHRMSKRKAIVRKLNALEALGSVTDICSDKTGTLTQARMVTTELWTPPDEDFRVTGEGIIPEGMIVSEHGEELDKETIMGKEDPLKYVLLSSALCHISNLFKEDTTGEWQGTGDPTEIALQVLAGKIGLFKKEMAKNTFDFIAEQPFESEEKKMSVIYRSKETQETFVFTKGAPERVVEKCTHFQTGDKIYPIDKEFHELLSSVNTDLASRALRSLGFAYKCGKDLNIDQETERSEIESGLVFVGLAGIYDPPRSESAPSVATCQEAGICVRMLTGDHPITAQEISKKLNIIDANSINDGKQNMSVVPAPKFNKMSDAELDGLHDLPRVVARCSPESKVKMIEALNRRNRFVAMTGDGVNDAPALRKADIGIAMGKSGSDVAKQTSDIILTDDNFSTIVMAVEEGRKIYENVVKFIIHLMTANVSEIIALVIGLAFVDSNDRSVYIMSPLQILWLNLSTSSPASLGLGVEAADKDIMKKPPRSSQKNWQLFEIVSDILYYGFWIGVLMILNFVIVVYGIGEGDLGSDCNSSYSDSCEDVFRARSTVFASSTLMFLLHAYNCKHTRKSLLQMKWFDNQILLWSLIIGFIIIIPFFYIPYVNDSIFKHSPITYEWAIVVGTNVVFIILAEFYKVIKRLVISDPLGKLHRPPSNV